MNESAPSCPPTLRLRRVGSLKPPVPAYQSAQAAGLDLCAALEQPLTLQPGERGIVSTGFAMAVPPGYEGQVRPRSGLAFKHGVTVLNSPGTIDADYRGEVKVVLINHGQKPFAVEPNMRVAQLVVCPVGQVSLRLDTELDETERGSGGYGSTGV